MQNNDLICFGLSSHETEELMPNWTPKAQKDLAIVIITIMLIVISSKVGIREIEWLMLLQDQSTDQISIGPAILQELKSEFC